MKPPKVTAHVRKDELTPHSLLPSEAIREALGIDARKMKSHEMATISDLLWSPEGASDEEKSIKLIRAIELYESLNPTDGAEGMLAEQMVATHSAALECLRRAALPNQTSGGRDMSLKHAYKLMTLYAQQLATLNKHRGKGQQKVTVEHVNIEAGGQAIVGNVEAGPGANHDTAADNKTQKVTQDMPNKSDSKVQAKSAAPRKAR